MPVIIDEVIISIEVTNQTSGGPGTTTFTPDEKQTLINECIERILEILERKKER
jgi:hypothetical protein